MSTPTERSLNASIAAHTKWGTTDRTAGTAAARSAFLQRFENEADPDGVLSEPERQRRAESLRKAYFKRLAKQSLRSRAARGSDDAA